MAGRRRFRRRRCTGQCCLVVGVVVVVVAALGQASSLVILFTATGDVMTVFVIKLADIVYIKLQCVPAAAAAAKPTYLPG